jgi:ribosomal protein S18 acetylase RimI-like enzyme
MTLVVVRPARRNEARRLAELLAEIAEERDSIASEPPIDLNERSRAFASSIDGTIVAVADDEIVGSLHVERTRFGVGEIGMGITRPWRGRGVGSLLMTAAIEKARADGLHKLSLEVFPHNTAAIALYRKFGFADEGLRVRHYRRASGELWDALVMGRPV